jgi:DNA (cytosine-5)-methyltransferase 1
MKYSVAELCIGAGGQAIGLERAGLEHVVGIDIDHHACATVRLNRPQWDIITGNIEHLDGRLYKGIDILAGGIPCPPFSVAGKQLGPDDERDLFPQVLRLAAEMKPAVVLIENVPGFAESRFESYRAEIFEKLAKLGYRVNWRILNAADYGVPQLRPRFVLVAALNSIKSDFVWPAPFRYKKTVAQAISDLMGENNWQGLDQWREKADQIAPTLVGGSKKHGGPDLGPTRAKRKWLELGVDGMGIANEAPSEDKPVDFLPRLTVQMAARIQGFPDSWKLVGGKTAAYRQIGNAFPPPVAEVVGKAINQMLHGTKQHSLQPLLFPLEEQAS